VLYVRLMADSVEEVRSGRGVGDGWRFCLSWQRRVVRQPAAMGCGIGISFASFLRFWAVAARRNSS
jgi:hypothetical protein